MLTSIFPELPQNELTNGILKGLGLGNVDTYQAELAKKVEKNVAYAVNKRIIGGEQNIDSFPAYGATQSIPAGIISTVQDNKKWFLAGAGLVGLFIVIKVLGRK